MNIPVQTLPTEQWNEEHKLKESNKENQDYLEEAQNQNDNIQLKMVANLNLPKKQKKSKKKQKSQVVNFIRNISKFGNRKQSKINLPLLLFFKKNVQKLIIVIRLGKQFKGIRRSASLNIEKKQIIQEPIKRRTSILPLYPTDLILAFWNLLLMLMLVLTAILVPYRVSFIDESIFWNNIDLAFDIYFCCDMVMNLISGFYDEKNKLVTSWNGILKNYITGWFLIDVIAIFPFDRVLSGSVGSNYNQLFRLLRLPRLYQLTQIVKLSKGRNNFISQIFQYFSMSPAHVKLIQIVIMMLSMSHFVACLWYFTAKWDDFSEETWVYRYKMDEQSLITRYVSSYYWYVSDKIFCIYYKEMVFLYRAFQTLTVVGYGDFWAITMSQQILAICWMLIGVIFYSFTIGNLAGTIMEMNQKGAFVNDIMDQFEDVVMMCRIPETLSDIVQRYFDLNYMNNHFWGVDYNQIFHGLPTIMKQKVSLLIYAELIEKINYLQINLTYSSDILPECFFLKKNPQEILFRTNDPACEVYIVISGCLFYVDEDGQILFQADPGDLVGEIEVINQTKRKFNAFCSNDITFLKIKKEYFLEKTQQYEDVWNIVLKRKIYKEYILAYQIKQCMNSRAKIKKWVVTPQPIRDRRKLRLKYELSLINHEFTQKFDVQQYFQRGFIQSDKNRLFLDSKSHYKVFHECLMRQQQKRLQKLKQKQDNLVNQEICIQIHQETTTTLPTHMMNTGNTMEKYNQTNNISDSKNQFFTPQYTAGAQFSFASRTEQENNNQEYEQNTYAVDEPPGQRNILPEIYQQDDSIQREEHDSEEDQFPEEYDNDEIDEYAPREDGIDANEDKLDIEEAESADEKSASKQQENLQEILKKEEQEQLNYERRENELGDFNNNVNSNKDDLELVNLDFSEEMEQENIEMQRSQFQNLSLIIPKTNEKEQKKNEAENFQQAAMTASQTSQFLKLQRNIRQIIHHFKGITVFQQDLLKIQIEVVKKSNEMRQIFQNN